MKKAILIFFLFEITILFQSLIAQDHTIGQSVYTLTPNDPQAVYFTREYFKVAADGVRDDAPALQAAIDLVLKPITKRDSVYSRGYLQVGKNSISMVRNPPDWFWNQKTNL
jgi:hypothetical protein